MVSAGVMRGAAVAGGAGGAERRRVVVTGLGAVTPSGIGVAALWESVAAGRSAIRLLGGDVSGGDAAESDAADGAGFAGLPVRIGGVVNERDLMAAVGERSTGLPRHLSPVQRWAVAAADEALEHAGAGLGVGSGAVAGSRAGAQLEAVADPPPGLSADPPTGSAFIPWDATRLAVIAATGSGPVDAMQSATRAFDARGPRAVPPGLSVYGSPDSVTGILSQRYGALGSAHSVSAACASGSIGLGEALRSIRHGYADAVLVVGMEDCLNPVNIASNTNLRALARGYEADPTAACRPFDRGRSGFVMSQGAAAVLIEAEDVARARGARVLAELAGFGSSSDAYHATAPHPEGRGGAIAVRNCLADAGVGGGVVGGGAGVDAGAAAGAAAIDHINAHGTGTPAGDAAELAALALALGPAARDIPLTATKSSTGHLLGAAGVVEAVISVLSLRDGLLPPTVNLDDPEFPDWNIVTGSARPAHLNSVLSTSFGFGGHNGAVLLRRGDTG